MAYAQIIEANRELSEELCKSDAVCDVVNTVAPTLATMGATIATGNPVLGQTAAAAVRVAQVRNAKQSAEFFTQLLLAVASPLVVVVVGGFLAVEAVKWTAKQLDDLGR